MNRLFTTQDCGFCYIARGLVTGCRTDRPPEADGYCAKCHSKLPPRGTILSIKYLRLFDPISKEETVATGYMIKVQRKLNDSIEWTLFYGNGGARSVLYPAIGQSSSEFKEWISSQHLEIEWPPDPMPRTQLVPFSLKKQK